MDNILLKIKNDLEKELKIKVSINSSQKERCDYIGFIIGELEKKFYELMENKINISDFLKYINKIDSNIIFDEVTAQLRNSLNLLNANINKQNVQSFYNELYHLVKVLKSIKHEKQTKILIKEGEIDKVARLYNNIDDNGEFVFPIDNQYLMQLEYTLLKIQSEYILTQNRDYLFYEIAKKNNVAIKKFQIRRNANTIIKNRQQVQDAEIKSSPELQLDENQQKIYNEARKIIDDNQKNIKIITDIEKDYISDLKDIYDLEEIKKYIELMPNHESSIKLIINAINMKLKEINEDNKTQELQMIEKYINLYKIYRLKQEEKNETQEKITKNEQNQKTIETMTEELFEIIEIVAEDDLELFGELSQKQFNILKSFVDIGDEEDFQDIDETLKEFGINLDFQLLYNNFVKLNKSIEEFKELEELYNQEEKINEIKRIIDLFKKI